jgi:hypothetical protein
MKKFLPFPLLVVVAALTACGGSDTPADAVTSPESAPEAVAKPAANNPLAAEQQFIKEAQAVQGILDQDAARKKQAVDNAN